MAHDCTPASSEETTSSDQAECRVQIGPDLVGDFPTKVERYRHDGQSDKGRTRGHNHTSDASGSWDCGACTTEVEWFQLRWPPACREVHITVRSSSNHSGDGDLGAAVDRPDSAMSMRQSSSGRDC